MWLILCLSVANADDGVASSDGEGSEGPSWIINGEDATAEDYPMTGAVLFGGDLGGSSYYELPMMWCSSTLIAPDTVLLAAHCVDEELIQAYFPSILDIEFRWTRVADLSAYDGTTSLEWPEDAVPAVHWLHHEGYSIYDFDMGLAENDDIALIFLSEPVLDVPHAYPPTATEAEQVAKGNPVVIVGWGQQTDASYPPSGTYGIKQMGSSDIAQLGTHEFQVGADREDTRQCHGDSGGPTFMDFEVATDEKMRIIGVTSHAYDESDCRRTGGVSTRVDQYLDWIDAQMRAACADGTRVWCEQEGIVYASDEEPGPDDTGTTGDDTGTTGDDTGTTGADDSGWPQPPGTSDRGDDDGGGDLSGCGCSSAGPLGLS